MDWMSFAVGFAACILAQALLFFAAVVAEYRRRTAAARRAQRFAKHVKETLSG